MNNGQNVQSDKLKWDAHRVNYDVNYVKSIKFYIPHQSRKWDNDQKCWMVDHKYEGVMRILRGRSFDVREGINWYLAWNVLFLQPNASLELIEDTVRYQLKKNPDNTGAIHIADMLIEDYGRPGDTMFYMDENHADYPV